MAALVYFSALEHLATYKRLISAAEVAELLGVHKLTVYRMAKAGTLRHYRSGPSFFYEPRAVAEYLHAHEVRG
jgi:excisionase family DNA binding protein